jgi:hypothetical protein
VLFALDPFLRSLFEQCCFEVATEDGMIVSPSGAGSDHDPAGFADMLHAGGDVDPDPDLGPPPGGPSAYRSATPFCTATAQATASTRMAAKRR